MSKFECPVCKTVLTEEAYEKALGIVQVKERMLTATNEKLSIKTEEHKEQLRQAHAREKAVRETATQDAAKYLKEKQQYQRQLKDAKDREREARQSGVQAERQRNKRLLQGKEGEIERLKERVVQIETGATPQMEGLEFESKLVHRLQSEFPDDQVELKGKGGDVLQKVRFEQAVAGVVIYECKRTQAILAQHVRQTLLAKEQRRADFAVLVTTGRKEGFTGFCQIDGVLVACPGAVVHLTCLLRKYLIEMKRFDVDQKLRATIAERLLEYVT